MQDAVAHLDVVWNTAPIMNRLIDVALLREELERDAVELSDEELQRGLDGLRRIHKLYDTETTQRWMEQRGLTHEQLEELVADNLTYLKVRERVTGGRVERYFEEHGPELASAHVAQLECLDEDNAHRLHHQILAGELDFFEAAQQHFLAAPAQVRLGLTTLRRCEAAPELAAAVFAAQPGDIVGPVRVGERHVIARVMSVIPARLDEPTRTAIEAILFEAWLAERRQTAIVTWLWGTSNRAPAGT